MFKDVYLHRASCNLINVYAPRCPSFFHEDKHFLYYFLRSVEPLIASLIVLEYAIFLRLGRKLTSDEVGLNICLSVCVSMDVSVHYLLHECVLTMCVCAVVHMLYAGTHTYTYRITITKPSDQFISKLMNDPSVVENLAAGDYVMKPSI